MFKKLCLIALVCTLALSLTSCSKRQNLSAEGYALCSGNVGYFDVYVKAITAGNYKLIIIPAQMAVNGELINVALSDGANPEVIIGDTPAYEDQQISAMIYEADYSTYDRLVIAPIQEPIEEGDPAVCELPRPGDGYNYY